MSDPTNRCLVVPEHGASNVLTVEDRPIPEPGAGQLVVAVAASGVNFIEVYQREGVYPMPTPFVLGGEGAGRVSAVGPDVEGFQVGDTVAWTAAPGSHADYVVVGADKAVPVPADVPVETAAATMLQGLTAHYLVNSSYSVQPGDAVLVHAAAGGVGQLLVQLSKARGAFVIATASTAAKLELARALGADALIDYTGLDSAALADAVRAANHGQGVSVAYDGVGRSTFEASVASLEPRGTAVLFGAASGQVPPFDLQRLNGLGSLYVTRPSLVHYTATREELLWRAGDILAAVADGALKIDIGGRYSLSEAARAYDDLEARRSTGKLLLTR